MESTFRYDIVVVGAGHAGCEAAAAAARMGAKTVLITMDMNKIAQMSCNPAVGGIAKGQIVREIDALGGQMGEVTDATAIQFRMLNRSKGPAMWSPRAQCDRNRFSQEWRRRLENTPNLHIWQDEVTDVLAQDGKITGVRTVWGATFEAKAVVITTGTFLNGLMHIGRKMVAGGRCAEPAAAFLTDSIGKLGITYDRMKTGTPVRIDARSVHYEDMVRQDGETAYHRFSFVTDNRALPQLPCWTCQTNPRVHEILRAGLEDSPLYNGQIQSIGPRYCPSIETKIVTFAERDEHHLFLEPEGLDTNEMYLNGFSSSLPMEIQLEALRQIPCFRDIVVYRPGYAIEYDFFQPTQLRHTLETKAVEGLYLAGQVNGTTGYEEAAGQGLMAGINAVLKLRGEAPFVLHRDEAYIGVLIDDLVTKGVDEPYRMFTSRAEFRILLRQDNADVRLTPYAIKYGLATKERIDRYNAKLETIDALQRFCRETSVKPSQINDYLDSIGSAPLERGTKLADLVTRPGVLLADLIAMRERFEDSTHKAENISDDSIDTSAEHREHITVDFNGIDTELIETTEVEMKYQGYIERERQMADKMKRLEEIHIQGHFRYDEIQSLSTEARQKLTAIDPETLGQASRIPGVSPSDISVLMVLMHR